MRKFSITDNPNYNTTKKFRITDDPKIIDMLVKKERLQKELVEKKRLQKELVEKKRLEIQKCKEQILRIIQRVEQLIIEKHNENLEKDLKMKIDSQNTHLKSLKSLKTLTEDDLNKIRIKNEKELEELRKSSEKDLERKIEWNNLELKLIEIEERTGGSTLQKKRILKAPTKGKAVKRANKIAK